MVRATEPDQLATSGSLTAAAPFVSPKARSYYTWLKWIVDENLPFNFVESVHARKNSNIEHNMCRGTLMKFCEAVLKSIVQRIIEELPPSFGIIVDGWDSGGGSHREGIFAVFPDPHKKIGGKSAVRCLLLSVSPLDDEKNFTAANTTESIRTVLRRYGKESDDLLFVVGDNVAVNRVVARTIGCPLIGCASHKFALAANKLYSEVIRVFYLFSTN